MNLRKITSIIVLFTFLLVLVSGCGSKADKASLEDTRKQTLFATGLTWGPPSSFNYFTGMASFPCNNSNNELMYETLCVYNELTGELEPHLADKFEWKDKYTLEVKMDQRAHFNDGHKLDANDVVYSYELGKRYPISWSDVWTNIESMEKLTDDTVVIHVKKQGYNKYAILEALCGVPIHAKHAWEKVEKDGNYKIDQINKYFNDKAVASGPYKVKSYDDMKITLERDDNYWGKEKFGGLPAPKYVVHVQFKSNDAANLALKSGQLDYTQDFIAAVWKMQESGVPIQTYLKEKPYYLSDSMPSIYFNFARKPMNDVNFRKALAYCIDYKQVADIAMSGYSGTVTPSLLVNVPSESKYYDAAALKPLQWETNLEKANQLLDSIGAKKGADGIRVMKDGTRLGPFKLECPYGWTEWNAALEIVMQNAKKAGIELKTYFPEDPVWENDRNTSNFDIIMSTPADYLTPAGGWKRAHDILSSKNLPKAGEQAYWNFGRYNNPKANELLDSIAAEEDDAKIKSLYTELNKIYLTDIPTIPLMYRPLYYFTANTSIWEGFPSEKDTKKIPPYCFDGAGIKSLYELKNK